MSLKIQYTRKIFIFIHIILLQTIFVTLNQNFINKKLNNDIAEKLMLQPTSNPTILSKNDETIILPLFSEKIKPDQNNKQSNGDPIFRRFNNHHNIAQQSNLQANKQLDYDGMFYTYFYVGKNSEPIKMIISLSSSLSKYIINKDKAFVTGCVAQDRVQLQYGDASLIVEKFKFFSFNQATSYNKNYGIVGLGREFVSPSQNSGPLLLQTLRQSGNLKQGVFSIMIGSNTEQSTLEIGGYSQLITSPPQISANSGVAKSISNNTSQQQYEIIKWFSNLYYAQEWQVEMNAYLINASLLLLNGTQPGRNHTAKAVISSTIQYLQFPDSIKEDILKKLTIDKQGGTQQIYNAEDGEFLTYSTCNISAYPSINLRLDDTWFEIKPKTFILEKPATIQGDYCPIGISSSGSNDIILGLVFMRNYYMIFDFDNDKIGVAQSKFTQSAFKKGQLPFKVNFTEINNNQPAQTVVPNQPIAPKQWFSWSNQTIIIIEVVIIIILLLGVGAWYYLIKQKATNLGNRTSQPDNKLYFVLDKRLIQKAYMDGQNSNMNSIVIHTLQI
ncbi:eukaryotic aspartyl protease family protein [Stylonychia lemnae]|uniref:Eukaryotic aspartyl protease family protein n=1 Tax=Stylonychia lemnae TaxID=5949 RepID=A0A078A442_STYLE|nr:eukaryotic aspartyl protease family protein [Stylonychia lemnae]|eukprot:CDW76293.1 eukaryotic aspartyl protease family protein [Stylonychia lemnae]